MKYSVIGLGKLGASMAGAIAAQGHEVIGVDVNQRSVELVNEGRAPVQETNLDRYISENSARIKATLSHAEAVLGSDLSFCIVPTPSDERGAFSLQYASWAFKELGQALREKDSYHTFVLTSTVLPGSCRYGLVPVLEKESGKQCGKDFGFCYSPEFIALGSIIHDFLHPDFTLVGEFDEKSGASLEEAYRSIMPDDPPCKRMSLENAELTKIALNTFVTTKITYANMLAELCETLPYGDVDVVTDAVGTDSRIGTKYLRGGLGYGGPCFPRDNVALGFISRALELEPSIPQTVDTLNRGMPDKLVDRFRPYAKKGATIAILGLAYKPFSHVVEESQSVRLANALSEAGARVVAYDPLAGESARGEVSGYGRIVIVNSIERCLEGADVVIVTTMDPEFAELSLKDFEICKPNPLVFDLWRVLGSNFRDSNALRYEAFGLANDHEARSVKLRELWSPKDGSE